MFKPPMLAPSKPFSLEQAAVSGIKWMVQPKYDGIRVTMYDGVPYTRSGKQIPNIPIRRALVDAVSQLPRASYDGELVLWDATGQDYRPFNDVQSIVMRKSTTHETAHWMYMIFDIALPIVPFHRRYTVLSQMVPWSVNEHIFRVGCHDINDPTLVGKYEGLILRNPDAPYKHGRCTTLQNILHKVVEWVRDEARVVGWEELMHYDTVPGNKLGAFILCSKGGVKFKVGSGFTDEQRINYWDRRNMLYGRLVTYKSKPFGMKEAPRSPIFVGFRSEEDLS